MPTQLCENLAERMAAMDRASLIGMLRGFHCSFQIDFTDEFLDSISVDRLRHIILAASLHASNSGGNPSPGLSL